MKTPSIHMFKSKPKRFWAASSFVAIVLAVLMVFQNCAPVVPEEDLSSQNSLPFAFDTKVDTLAYMSCNRTDSGADKDTYFSFRASAKTVNGGLRFSQGFLSSTPNYSVGRRVEALANNAKSAGAQLQMSIRDVAAYNVYHSGSSGTPREDYDYDNILTSLSTTAIAEAVSNMEFNNPSNNRLRNFNSILGGTGKTLDFSLRMMTTEGTVSDIRNKLNSGAQLLTIAYVNSAAPANQRMITLSPDDTDDYAYGVGLALTFQSGFSMRRGANNAPTNFYDYPGIKTVNVVQEKNLETNSAATATWSCAQSYRFMVVRPQDVGITTTDGIIDCNPPTSDDPSDNALKIVRRVLPESSWGVDMTKRCIVARHNGAQTTDQCYGDVAYNGASIVNYTGTFGPTAAPTACGKDSGGNDVTKVISGSTKRVLCPNYVTICVRSGT